MYAGIYITCEYTSGNRRIVQIQKFTNNILELEYMDFVNSALQNTDILLEDFDGFANINDAIIDPLIFIEYVNCFYLHPSFLLKVRTKTFIDLDTVAHSSSSSCAFTGGTLKRIDAAIGGSLIVTPDALKSYIIKKTGGESIVREYERKKVLTDSSRRKIIAFLASYTEEVFGFTPSMNELSLVSRACLSLFDCLKSNSDDEIELIANKTNTGFLQIKLKNDRAKKRKLDKSFEEAHKDIPIDKQKEKTCSERVLKDINELKTLTLPDQLDLVKSKLKSTLEFRRQQMKSSEVNLFSEYGYFFICPELILYDFSLSYNESAPLLLNTWKKYQPHIFSAVKNAGKRILYTEAERESDWDSCTLSFINLLRLLPPPANGKKKISRLTDEQAVERIIKFKKPGLTTKEYAECTGTRAPFIVAVGSSKSSVSEYMVILDGYIIPMKNCCTVLEALDLVFKIHFIFNICYDNNLRLFWTFLQRNIYKIDCAVTPVTKELYNKLQLLLENCRISE